MSKKLKKKVSKFLAKAEKLGPSGKDVLTNDMLNKLYRMAWAGLDRKKKKK